MNNRNILVLGTSDSGGVTVYVASYIQKIKEFNFYIPLSKNVTKEKILKLFPDAHILELNQSYTIRNIYNILKEIKNTIDRYSIEIIHAHTLKAGFLAALYKFILNTEIKIIYTGHGLRFTQKQYFLSKLLFQLIERYVNRLSNKVIFIRKIDYDLAVKKNIVNSKKATYIPTQISQITSGNLDFDLFKKYSIKTPKIIINAASIYGLKNPLLFIEIAKLVLAKTNEISFLWFGEGEDRNEINKNLEIENLSHRIKFPGAVGSKEMRRIFKQVDGLLLTSKIETFPLIVLEAYSSNTVVFSSNFNGFQEIIKDQTTGFVYDMRHPKEAESVILETLFNDALTNKIQQNAKEFFNANFNKLDKFANQHLTLYNQV